MATDTRASKSGINKDTQKKLDAAYSHEDEDKARKWMEEITKEYIGDDFFDGLQDGSYLCKLFNKMHPESVIKPKHEKKTVSKFSQIENIDIFLRACKSFGMDEKDCFVTLDLQEKQNKNMVLATIFALGRYAQKQGLEDLPILGPKEAQPTPREFDEQKLREGRNVASLQMGTNQVAHQAGMTPYGMGRQIHDTRSK